MILPGTGRGTAPERRGGGGRELRKPAVYAARKLRRSMSPPEVRLWDQLWGKKQGYKVRRQHPIGPYVVDFFVREDGLVIEVDGVAHDFGDRPNRDARRDQYLREQGYRVLRVSAADVFDNLDGTVRHITAQVNRPLHRPSAGPPPRPGEDL